MSSFRLAAQQRDLNYYLDRAITKSPLINKSKNDNKIVNLDLKQINSVLNKPEINLVTGVSFAPIISRDKNSNRFEYLSDGATDYTGYDLALTEGGQYQYILCIKSKLMNSISVMLLNELQEYLKTMPKLVENAIYKQTDLTLLQIEVQNYHLENLNYEAEYMTNIYDLNLICGINDIGRIDLQDINLVLTQANSGKSNFLASFKLDSMYIIADQAINELKYKPQLDLFADAGLNAVYLLRFNRFGFSSGLAFSWNIFDGRQRIIQRVKSALNIQTFEFGKNKFMTQNDIKKKKILSQIISTDQRIILCEQQISQYDKLKYKYSAELSQGEVSVMDFKNLLRDLSLKKQEMLQLKMEKQVLINFYNYLNY